MDASESLKSGVIADLKTAFAKVDPPAKGNISTPPWDEGASEYFTGKPQYGHSVRDLKIQSAALFHFSTEALQYFLPAYLIAVIEDPFESGNILSSLIYIFSHDIGLELLPKLSREQREATAKFFEYVMALYDDSEGEVARIVDSLRGC